MKLIAALSAFVLSASTLAAYASPVEPFGSGTTLLVDGTAVDSASINLVSNGFTLNDHGSLLTLTLIQTPQMGLIPATGVFNVTDLCVNLGVSLNAFSPSSSCPALSVSFTDANFSSVNITAAVGLGVTESVSGNTAVFSVAQNGNIGLSSGTFTFVGPVDGPPSNSPVPEPGTFGLMATGLLGAAGAARRRFLA